MADPSKILFLCTGNSCRSQMAERWVRHLGGNRSIVDSAGIEAHGRKPHAISTMKQAGVDICAQEYRVVNTETMERADGVVTVCGHADDRIKVHWPLEDPAKATGSDDEIARTFATTRDEVEMRARELIAAQQG